VTESKELFKVTDSYYNEQVIVSCKRCKTYTRSPNH